MSHVLLYIPIVLVILAVLEACKQDDPRKIARRVLINFSLLTGVLLAGSAVIFAIQIWL